MHVFVNYKGENSAQNYGNVHPKFRPKISHKALPLLPQIAVFRFSACSDGTQLKLSGLCFEVLGCW